MSRWALILCMFATFPWNEASGATTGTIKFVQGSCCGILNGFDSKVGFRLPEGAGNLNVVIIGWQDSTTTLAPTAVTDDIGSAYAIASPVASGAGVTQAIYYAANIAGGWNHIRVHWNGAPNLPNVRILEYSGISATAPLDGIGVGVTGNGGLSGAANISTTFASDVLVSGTTAQAAPAAATAGVGWDQRVSASDVDAEDLTGVGVGTYPLPMPFPGTIWVTNAAAFRAASASGSVQLLIAGTGPGSGRVSGDGLDCHYRPAGVTGTCGIEVAVGSGVTLVATPDSNATFAGFNGGGCSTNLVCVIPAITADTVVTANFGLNTNCSGPFSQTNPPCNTTPLYPNTQSVNDKRLPVDKMLHLLNLANYGLPVPTCPYGGSDSDCVAQNTICWGSQVDNAGCTGDLTIASPASDGSPGLNDYQLPIYFTDSTMPVYQFCGAPEDPNVCIIVHMPSNAYWTGAARTTTSGCSDEFIGAWDNSFGIVFGAYRCANSSTPWGIGPCPGGGHAGTDTDPCPFPASEFSFLESEQLGVDQDFNWTNNNTRAGIIGDQPVVFGGAGDNLSFFAEMAPKARFEELETGILHALEGGMFCSNDTVAAVFPGEGAAGATTAQCNKTPAYECNGCIPDSVAPGGALIFLDYTDAQIAAMNLDPITNNIIAALSHYGSYLSVYGGNSFHGALTLDESIESGMAYTFQVGGQHPFFQLFRGSHMGSPNASVPQKAVICGDNAPPMSEYRCSAQDNFGNVLGPLYGIPPVGGTNILSHVHILDPCAVVGMTGPITWGGGATPTACTGEIIVEMSDMGVGTISSSPGGISCDHAPYCDLGIAKGTAVTLTAIPSAGHQFVGWSGSGCSGTEACVITAGATPQPVVATFQ